MSHQELSLFCTFQSSPNQLVLFPVGFFVLSISYLVLICHKARYWSTTESFKKNLLSCPLRTLSRCYLIGMNFRFVSEVKGRAKVRGLGGHNSTVLSDPRGLQIHECLATFSCDIWVVLRGLYKEPLSRDPWGLSVALVKGCLAWYQHKPCVTDSLLGMDFVST